MTNVTRQELLGRARELVPELRARAEKAEAERRMPEATNRAFHDAGFYKVFRPKRFGGYEMDFSILFELCAEIGRGCGSSAWILANVAGHDKVNGMRDPRAQDEIWGSDPDTLSCACFPTKDSRVRRVDGGVVLDGLWNFASGVDQASWNDFNIFLPRDHGPPEHVFALVPKSDYRVIDDWFVTGLAATGSRAVAVSDYFVPEYRLLSSELCRGGPTPGSAVNPGALYKAPVWALGGKMFLGPLLGIARGALDIMVEDLGPRRSVTGATLSEQPTVQVRVAEADAEIEAAAALALGDARIAEEYAARAERPPERERVRWRRNDAFAASLCLRAVERLHALAGARRLSSSDPFQRAFRDAHAAAAQITIAWDLQAVNYGRVMFGMRPGDPRI
jgi:3-hydroxy-9,10-secoandrosta-1,3,5(10)-triene-9,17-dione monooxygenase